MDINNSPIQSIYLYPTNTQEITKVISKINYANSLLASLAYLMINQQDAVGLIQFSDKINSFIPPKSNRSHLNTVINQLSETVEGKDTFIEPVLHEMAERINKRGLVILVSDLLDDPKKIMNGLKHFRHRKQEIIVFHIFSTYSNFSPNFNIGIRYIFLLQVVMNNINSISFCNRTEINI